MTAQLNNLVFSEKVCFYIVMYYCDVLVNKSNQAKIEYINASQITSSCVQLYRKQIQS